VKWGCPDPIWVQAAGRWSHYNWILKMPGGMPSVDITNEAATTLFSNHVLQHDIQPRLFFDIGTPDKNGHTSRWSVIKKHFRLMQDLLDITQGKVVKHAKFLTQFISWLQSHGITWAWKDCDRAIQHFRCMLRTLREKSLPPSTSPRGYPELQVLIDKFVHARAAVDEPKEVQIVPRRPRAEFQVQVHSEDEAPRDQAVIRNIVKTESEAEIDDDRFFTTPPRPQLTSSLTSTKKLAPIFHRFRSLHQHLPAAVPIIGVAKVDAEVKESVVESTAALVPKVLDASMLATLASQGSAAPRPKEYADQKNVEKQDKAMRKRLREKTSDSTVNKKGRGRPKKHAQAAVDNTKKDKKVKGKRVKNTGKCKNSDKKEKELFIEVRNTFFHAKAGDDLEFVPFNIYI